MSVSALTLYLCDVWQASVALWTPHYCYWDAGVDLQ